MNEIIKSAVDGAGKLLSDIRADGWVNILTGLGDALRDKTRSWLFQRNYEIPLDTLEATYYGDDLAAKIVGAVVEEAMRRGFEIDRQGSELDDVGEKRLCDAVKRLELAEKYKQAATWGRLFGGAALWFGAVDGYADDQPLNEERIRAVEFVHVLDRRELTPVMYYSNPRSPKFGKPQTYRVNMSGRALSSGAVDMVVHESRLILFPGVMTSAREQARIQGWDHSVLQRVYDVLVGVNSNWSSVGYLMQDASQAVYKVKGLVAMLAGGNEAAVKSRFELIELGRSVARAIVLDADGEEFERKQTPLAGIPDIIDRSWQRAAAAGEMPITRMFGMSPGGLNATGESDDRNWTNQAAQFQEQVLAPRLTRGVRLVARAEKLDPLKWGVCFKPLRQPTEEEIAKTRKTEAETAHIYITDRVIDPAKLAEQRFGASGYSAEIVVKPGDAPPPVTAQTTPPKLPAPNA